MNNCRYSSEHNTRVKEYLLNQIEGKYQEKCSPARVNSKLSCVYACMVCAVGTCMVLCTCEIPRLLSVTSQDGPSFGSTVIQYMCVCMCM